MDQDMNVVCSLASLVGAVIGTFVGTSFVAGVIVLAVISCGRRKRNRDASASEQQTKTTMGQTDKGRKPVVKNYSLPSLRLRYDDI